MRDRNEQPKQSKPDPPSGPSIELAQDLADIMDNPGAAYEDGELLDLGKHGKLDPSAPIPHERRLR